MTPPGGQIMVAEPPPAESSSLPSGRQQRRPSGTPALDLTGKITRPNDHYVGAGGFGDVHKCRYASSDGVKEVAVKVFRFSFKVAEKEGETSKADKMIRRELGIWGMLRHRNIVPFLGFVRGFERRRSISLVSKWMPNGCLDGFCAQYDDQLILSHRLQLLLDMANGLSHLHSLSIVHGDLTCTNVLIDRNFNACLTDFGLASMIGDIPEALRFLQMSSLRPGTIRWAAPELLSVNVNAMTQRTTKSDIYSFGNLTLLTLSGKHPWSEIQMDVAVILRLHQGDKPNRPTSRAIEDKHWEFIERCWSVVNERPRCRDVVASLKTFINSCLPAKPLRDCLCVPSDSTVIGPSDASSSLGLKNKRVHFDDIDRNSPTLPRKPSWHSGIPLNPYSPVLSPPELKRRQSLDRRSRPWKYASPWPDVSPDLQISPLLNGEASCIYFHFDLASPSFNPHFTPVNSGQTNATSRGLSQYAMYPPITGMRIMHDAIPQWPIDLDELTVNPPIMVGDVLYAIYISLHRRVRRHEWAQLGQHEADEVLRAHTRRCRSVPSSADLEASRGVKRIDYLLDKHIFRGLIKTPDKDGFCCWKLISVTVRDEHQRSVSRFLVDDTIKFRKI